MLTLLRLAPEKSATAYLPCFPFVGIELKKYKIGHVRLFRRSTLFQRRRVYSLRSETKGSIRAARCAGR